MGAVESMKVRVQLRTFFAGIFFLLLIGTIVYMLVAPKREDARFREEMGDPFAFVTDTARSPWIYVGTDGVISVYHEDCVSFTVFRLPEVVNGVNTLHIGNAFFYALPGVERLILPSTIANPRIDISLSEWTSLKEVVFREGIQDVSSVSLCDYDTLEAVYFPKSLSSLGSGVLRDGAGTPTIYYAGTEMEWFALGASAAKLSREYTVVFETSAPEEWLDSTKS